MLIDIYTSRNSLRLFNYGKNILTLLIYTSRNSLRLFNTAENRYTAESTLVEIL